MYARALFDIIHTSGDAALQLVLELQGGSEELFASRNTLAVVEDHLLNVAQTLAHLPPVVLLRLPLVDWAGWAALHQALRSQKQPRQDEVWYALRALLPATLVLLDKLRAAEPEWFEIHY
jgi:hypothetical protein